jgi:hypothetical protein
MKKGKRLWVTSPDLMGYNQYTSPKLTPSDAVNNRRIAVNNIRLEKTEEKFNVNSIL